MAIRRNTVTFIVNSAPPTSNHANKVSVRNRRVFYYPSPQLRSWRKEVSKAVRETELKGSEWYGAELVFELPLYYKNGNVKRVDLDNMIKYTIDEITKRVLVEGQPIDDSLIIELSAVKVDSQNLKTTVTIWGI